MFFLKDVHVADKSPHVIGRETLHCHIPLLVGFPSFPFGMQGGELTGAKKMSIATERTHRWHDAPTRPFVVLPIKKSLLKPNPISMGWCFAGILKNKFRVWVVPRCNWVFQGGFVNENVSASAGTERSIQDFGLRFGLRDTFPHRDPLVLHDVSLFPIDENLSDHGQTDYKIQQVSGEELSALGQVGPPDRGSEQSGNSNPSEDKNPSQVTWFTIAMTAIGLIGIVIGVVGFYHYLNLYLDSDTYKACALIWLAVCLAVVIVFWPERFGGNFHDISSGFIQNTEFEFKLGDYQR